MQEPCLPIAKKYTTQTLYYVNIIFIKDDKIFFYLHTHFKNMGY